MNEIELKEYFHQNRPHTSDDTTFLAEFSARMDAVEQIKRLHDASMRRCRRICVTAFVTGCIVGMAVIAFILLKPVSAPEFKTDILASLYSFVAEWENVIIFAVAAASLVFGLVPWKKGLEASLIK